MDWFKSISGFKFNMRAYMSLAPWPHTSHILFPRCACTGTTLPHRKEQSSTMVTGLKHTTAVNGKWHMYNYLA